MSDRFCQSALDRPTSFEAIVKGVFCDSSNSGPLGQSFGFPLETDVAISTGIRVLNFCYCPATILGTIGSIVIYAVDTMSGRWSWPHVVEELLERIIPSIAECDSSSSVVGKIFYVGVQASVFHSPPYTVFCGMPHPMGRKRFSSVPGRSFSVKTSTRLSVPISQGCCSRKSSSSTFTDAVPLGDTLDCVFASGDDCKASELLTDKVDKIMSRHRSLLFRLRCSEGGSWRCRSSIIHQSRD